MFELDRVVVSERDARRANVRIWHQWARAEYPRLDAAPLDNAAVRESMPWLAGRLDRGEPIVVRRPEELPAEAVREQSLMRHLGLRSAALFPLAVGTDVLGCVAFLTVAREHAWPEAVLDPLRLAAALVADALARTRVAVQLGQAVGFVRLMAALAATFVDTPVDTLDEHIVRALGRVARLLGADRGSVLQHSIPDRLIVRTHHWSREGIPASSTSEPEEAFPWLVAHAFKAHELMTLMS